MADTSQNRIVIPPVHANEVEHRRLLSQGVNSLFDGKINSVGSVTLDAGTNTTTLIDLRIGVNSVILLMPTTATAATANAAGIYITTTAESATITHNNTADLDKTFQYAVLGG